MHVSIFSFVNGLRPQLYKLHLLNKKASVSSDILVGHVMSSQNEFEISDGARLTLFNKGLISCDVNQR